MIHVPVQDGRQFQVPETLEPNANRPRRKADAGGEIHESAEIDAARSYRDACAESCQVGLKAPSGGNHGETGERAFAGLILQNEGHAFGSRGGRLGAAAMALASSCEHKTEGGGGQERQARHDPVFKAPLGIPGSPACRVA